MKKNVFRIIAILMTLGWMMLIYGFSAQSGEETGWVSTLITRPITDFIAACRGLKDKEELFLQVDIVVRSTAHFGEFAVLGGLLTLTYHRFRLQGYWLPLAFGTVYAILDEWHQAYSPGRVSDPMDVIIDTCGVVSGILLMRWLSKKWRKHHVYHQ